MRVADLMAQSGRVFLKSEWGIVGDGWPCVSFTKRSVGTDLGRTFVPGRDVLIYVGTTNPELTRDADHRSRLISAVVVEPSQILETRKIVPGQSWADSIESHGDRWPHALAIVRAALMDGPPYPAAREVVPQAYRSFGEVNNRGKIVEAVDDERLAVMALPVREIHLNLAPAVEAYLGLRASLDASVDKLVNAEAWRMAGLIITRVKAGGIVGVRVNPIRSAPIHTDLFALLVKKWQLQGGDCALCGGRLRPSSLNKLLQPSADRIDSADGSYGADNVHITHLACNLAKNQWGLDDFEDWLTAVRGIDPSAA